MHLQNRVTPFGDIVAIPQRGMFTGNRGIIHDPATKSLLSKRWASKAWLICSCEYKGRHRKVMPIEVGRSFSSWSRRSRCLRVIVHVSYVGAKRPMHSAALGRPRPGRKNHLQPQ